MTIMFNHSRQPTKSVLVAACLFAFYSAGAHAQDTEAAQEQSEASENIITIEEITVTGQRSFFLLRSQVEIATERLYSTYNDFNLEEDFDVGCETVVPTMSHISEQECWPEFFRDAVEQQAQNAMLLGDFNTLTIRELELQHARRFEELRANIIKVANENPQVAEALMELGKTEEALRLKKEECMKQPAFLFILRYCP